MGVVLKQVGLEGIQPGVISARLHFLLRLSTLAKMPLLQPCRGTIFSNAAAPLLICGANLCF